MKNFLLSLMMIIIFAGSAFAEEVTRLTYSDHAPLGNMRTRFLNDVFFRAIEKESNGHIKIDSHWNGEISISYDALKTVKEGTKAQITVIVPEYCMKELPLHQIFKSFPTGPAGQEQVNFFRGIYDEIPELMKEIDAQNLHVIFVATGYPAAFFSSKPLRNLKDIRGQKWRSASFWHKDFLTNAGAIPITMAWGQGVFDALNDGTLDGLMVNVDSGYDINAHKAAPHILTSQRLWLGHEYIIAMNKSVWESLSENDRRAIESAAESSYSLLGDVMNEAYTRQLNVLRSDGADVRVMTDEEVSFWEETTNYREIQNKYVSEHDNAVSVIEAVRKRINH
ncbi:MAG: TRAP transporter substrate-binding protein DctP [Synergistaceae bacterium]|nr:TRAP transporter substrate-binding protein DctP [Synergistaceae bacterium]